MADNENPSNKSRRKFLKNVGTGIVGTYIVSPAIRTGAKTLRNDFIDSIESKVGLAFNLNGKQINTRVKANVTLAEFLRDELNLTGTKLVCNQGECGSCTVLIDDQPVYSCHYLALDADGKNVLTIEGLVKNDEMSDVQQSFVDKDGLQCGFCTPGQIMAAYAVVKNNPTASDEEIKRGMSGNLCRCGAYPKIFDSVKSIIESKKGEKI